MIKKYIKQILISITILLITLLIVIGILIYIQDLTNKNILKNLGETVNQDAERINNKIQEHIRILETILNEIEEEKPESEDQIFNIYNRNSGKTEFSRIAILYENGQTSTSDRVIVDLSEDKDEFFQSDEIQISKSRISKVNNQEINIYSKKISFQNGNVVILLVVETDKYEEIFSNGIYNGNGVEYIITKNGEIIANSRKEENGKNIFEELNNVNNKEQNKIYKMKEEILENQIGQISYIIEGHNYCIAYEKLDFEDWTLIAIIPKNVIAEELNKLIKVILIVLIILSIIIFFIIIYLLILKAKKKEELYKLAYIDPITELGNYNYYKKELEERSKNDIKKTIIILDIDKFKVFNRKYGHIIGNKLLKNIGENIKNNIRKTDLVCRLANDVFAIYISDVVEIENLTERLNKNLSKIKIDNITYNIKITMGIYVVKEKEKSAEELIDKAIIAHDNVKGIYNKNYGLFNKDLEIKLSKENEIESSMNEAIEKEEFEIYYQPKISIKTEKVEGAEALVRWNKDGKMISPGEFIPIFEKNYFIIKLDEYIYEKVCSDIKKSKKELKAMPLISVNVSKESLTQNNFVNKYIKINNKYGINAEEIELEITERTAVDDNINMEEILMQIKNEGFKIALDDFGTGYSSLNMLEVMPIDIIKIDKSFIDNINKKVNLIEIIINIAKSLNLKTVAEGVENEEQVEYLKIVGCDLIQGYYYSKPLKLEEFKKFINKFNNE